MKPTWTSRRPIAVSCSTRAADSSAVSDSGFSQSTGLAGAQALRDQAHVREVRRRDHDRVGLLDQRLGRVGRGAADLAGDGLGARRVGVVHEVYVGAAMSACSIRACAAPIIPAPTMPTRSVMG